MGAWQGWWVTKMGVSSFIVTLAGMLYFRGISMIATNGATVAPLPAALKQIATGFLPPVASIALILARACDCSARFRVVELRRGVALGVVEAQGRPAARAAAAARGRDRRDLARFVARACHTSWCSSPSAPSPPTS